MGQRANLVIVSGGRAELFYSHWRANTLDVDLFWGPTYATAFVRAQQPGDSAGWLDEVWAEGGAVVDHDDRVLLFYGGEEVMWNVPRRRLHLQLMSRLWSGWDVRWAHEGIADIAGYVGVPRESVLTADDDEDPPTRGSSDPGHLTPPKERDWVTAVGTVRFRDGSIMGYPTDDQVTTLLKAGPRLLEAATAAPGERHVRWADWTSEFPQGGFHLDEEERAVDFWLADPTADCAARAARRWPGWTVRFHGDHFESHVSRAGGVLEFPGPNPAALAEVLRDALLRPAGRSGVDLISELAERLRGEGGEEGTVNPHALRDAQLDLPTPKKIELLEAALSDVRPGPAGRT